ncbi:MAG: hypothetical protein ABJK20_12170 [Halieaceae bacterium]
MNGQKRPSVEPSARQRKHAADVLPQSVRAWSRRVAVPVASYRLSDIGLVSALLLVTARVPVADAHLPSLFGKEYIRAEQLADVQPAANIPALDIEAGDPGPYEEQLEDLALRDGPYASGLADPLIGVAQIYKQRGDYKDAIEAYRRALHVIRVNDGLRSERQLPLLKDLMTVYRIEGDGDALDDAYHYYFNVHGNGHPPYTESSIAATLEYMDWQREAFGIGMESSTEARARSVQAYLRNARIIEEMAAQPSVDVNWYEKIVMSQMANLYLILGEDMEEYLAVGLPSGAMSGAEARSEGYVRDRVTVIQQSGVKIGRRLLQDLIDRNEKAPAIERAGLYLELGDWNQWNGSLRQANEAYTVVESLLQTEDGALLDDWLSEPMELPDERALWRSSAGLSTEQHPVFTVRYDVDEKGNVRNVEILSPEEGQGWPTQRLKRMLRDTHFRPRFSGGQPLSMTGVQRQYQVLD